MQTRASCARAGSATTLDSPTRLLQTRLLAPLGRDLDVLPRRGGAARGQIRARGSPPRRLQGYNATTSRWASRGTSRARSNWPAPEADVSSPGHGALLDANTAPLEE